jgi:hypothetical protein
VTRDDRVVHLDVPCHSGSLALLRLAMVTVLSDAGATMMEMDAGRFAVSELAALAFDATRGAGRLSVTIRPLAHRVRLDGETSRGCRTVEPSKFVTGLLDQMMVEWSAASGNRCRFHAVVPVCDVTSS